MTLLCRKTLINELEGAMVATTDKQLTAQSTCVVYSNNTITSYNGEIVSVSPSIISFECAVVAAPLLEVLQKMPEDTLKVSLDEKANQIIIKGKNKVCKLRTEREIQMPIELFTAIDDGKWADISDDFLAALDVAQECAADDTLKMALTCVHLTPDYLESSDGSQFVHYKLKTGVDEDVLIRADGLQKIIQLRPTKIGVSKVWVHFAKGDTIMSCLRHTGNYPDTTGILEFEGETLEIQGTLIDSIARARIFAKKNIQADRLTVELSTNKLVLKGDCSYGSYEETKQVAYEGDDISFGIQSKVLEKIAKTHHKYQVNERVLCIYDDVFQFVVLLNKVKDE